MTNPNVNEWYDLVMAQPFQRNWFGGSEFYNYGYWDSATKTQQEASEKLLEKLLSFIPEKRGHVLDVACGMGASSQRLLKCYSDVTGINISEQQLERCRVLAPGAKFINMDATGLRFEDGSFDDVVCVEAAFHFNTRAKFFEEAFRVLVPGGKLVLSDILHCEWCHPEMFPMENYVPDISFYSDLLKDVGFEKVELVDATEQCIIRFCKARLEYVTDLNKSGELNWLRLAKAKDILLGRLLRIRQYVLVCATKGAGTDGRSQSQESARQGQRRSARGKR